MAYNLMDTWSLPFITKMKMEYVNAKLLKKN
jgi:hypothetical protein